MKTFFKKFGIFILIGLLVIAGAILISLKSSAAAQEAGHAQYLADSTALANTKAGEISAQEDAKTAWEEAERLQDQVDSLKGFDINGDSIPSFWANVPATPIADAPVDDSVADADAPDDQNATTTKTTTVAVGNTPVVTVTKQTATQTDSQDGDVADANAKPRAVKVSGPKSGTPPKGVYWVDTQKKTITFRTSDKDLVSNEKLLPEAWLKYAHIEKAH